MNLVEFLMKEMIDQCGTHTPRQYQYHNRIVNQQAVFFVHTSKTTTVYIQWFQGAFIIQDISLTVALVQRELINFELPFAQSFHFLSGSGFLLYSSQPA